MEVIIGTTEFLSILKQLQLSWLNCMSNQLILARQSDVIMIVHHQLLKVQKNTASAFKFLIIS